MKVREPSVGCAVMQYGLTSQSTTRRICSNTQPQKVHGVSNMIIQELKRKDFTTYDDVKQIRVFGDVDDLFQ
jgi:hypothetical protein